MSPGRAPHQVVTGNEPDEGISIGDNLYTTQFQAAPNQASQGVPSFVDGSGPIFSMYLDLATEEDKNMVESWKADADGILIFTGLFSAAVASLISVSIQDIRSNPQDTSNFYLANIYQTLADPNRTNSSGSLPSSPPTFSPPNYAVWVNSLWFMSLVISLTCALLATLLQQWARRYLKVTRSHYSPHKRARIRAFFFEGVENSVLPWVVDTLPTLLHISLYLFFAGLVVFLHSVNLTIFKLVLSWVSVCAVVYGCLTLIPIFRHDRPYYTPLTSLAWPIILGIPYVTFRAFRLFTWSSTYFPCIGGGPYDRLRSSQNRYHGLLVQGLPKTAEEAALNPPPEIDTRAFKWTFDTLDEDDELERFFAGLPGFRNSKVVRDPLPGLTWEQQWDLLAALIGLLDRTSSSDSLPKEVKSRRLTVCAKAFDGAVIPNAFSCVFYRILSEEKYGRLQSAGIVQFLKGWGDSKDRPDTLMQAITSVVVARAQRRDDSWFALASKELGVLKADLEGYAAHGDNLSLAILLHTIRQQFSHYRERSWPAFEFSKALEMASEFNVQDTSPELQHKFCALWNEIVLKARNDKDGRMAFLILGRIRHVYVTLHQDIDPAATQFSASINHDASILWQPFSYPLCSIPGHLPDSTTHIHGGSASTIFARTVLCDNAAVVPASLSTPGTSPSSVPTPLRVIESPAEAPSLDNGVYLPGSFLPAHSTAVESLPVTSQNPSLATAGAIHDIAITTSKNPTPNTSTSSPLSSTPPPAAIALVTPFSAPDLPSPTSSNPVPDDIPIGSCRSIIVTTTPGASPGPTSARDLSVAAEDDGSPSPKPGLRKDAPDPLSVDQAIHESTVVTLDLPPQLPPLPSINDSDVAVTSPSRWEQDVAHTGDHPLPSSHCRYDIV